MKIAVYGAYGYQGKLVAAELHRRGIELVLVGRSAERLRQAARQLGIAGAEPRVASLDDPEGLGEALRDSDAVINCAGPFTAAGEAVVRAAIAVGSHYVDTSGEQLFIKRIFDTYAQEARRAGVTVIPALTDGGLPASLIAELTAALVAPVVELTVAHRVTGGAVSRGSMRSALQTIESFSSGGLVYQDGRWRDDLPARRAEVVFPGSREPSPMVRLAAPDVVTIPRHVPARRLEALIEEDTMAGLAAVTQEIVESVPDDGPAEDIRRAATWTLVADATGSDGRRARGVVEGSDTYGTTAVVAVEGARRLAAEGSPAGVLAPAAAFDAADFLDFLAPHGVRWHVGPAGEGRQGSAGSEGSQGSERAVHLE